MTRCPLSRFKYKISAFSLQNLSKLQRLRVLVLVNGISWMRTVFVGGKVRENERLNCFALFVHVYVSIYTYYSVYHVNIERLRVKVIYIRFSLRRIAVHIHWENMFILYVLGYFDFWAREFLCVTYFYFLSIYFVIFNKVLFVLRDIFSCMGLY